MFPKRGLLCGVAGATICYLCELPGLVAVIIGVVTFLGMGGWSYSRIILKTLPRDLRLVHLRHVVVRPLFITLYAFCV